MPVQMPNPCNPCNPCGEFDPPWEQTDQCPDICLTMARCWELVVAGVSAGDGCLGNCAGLNGVFTLVHSSGCTFQHPVTTLVCGSLIVPWIMLAGVVDVILKPGAFSVETYAIPIGLFNCNATNVFSRVGGPTAGQCQFFPAELIIEPIFC